MVDFKETNLELVNVIRKSKCGNLYMDWVAHGNAYGDDLEYVDFYYSLDDGFTKLTLFRLSKQYFENIKSASNVTNIAAYNIKVFVDDSIDIQKVIQVKFGDSKIFELIENYISDDTVKLEVSVYSTNEENKKIGVRYYTVSAEPKDGF